LRGLPIVSPDLPASYLLVGVSLGGIQRILAFRRLSINRLLLKSLTGHSLVVFTCEFRTISDSRFFVNRSFIYFLARFFEPIDENRCFRSSFHYRLETGLNSNQSFLTSFRRGLVVEGGIYYPIHFPCQRPCTLNPIFSSLPLRTGFAGSSPLDRGWALAESPPGQFHGSRGTVAATSLHRMPPIGV
jgi:hypothetical protein